MHGIVTFDVLFDLLPFLFFLCLPSPPPALPPQLLFVLIEVEARLLCLEFGPDKGLLRTPNSPLSCDVTRACRLQRSFLLLVPCCPPLLGNLRAAVRVAGLLKRILPCCLRVIALAIRGGKGALGVAQ